MKIKLTKDEIKDLEAIYKFINFKNLNIKQLFTLSESLKNKFEIDFKKNNLKEDDE